MTGSLHSRNYSAPFGWTATFSWPLMSLRPARDMSLERWLLVACFSSVKNHNVSGPHLFPSFTTHQKNPFAIGRNSERCSYHTDLSRFVLPISDPSTFNFSQFVGFQNSPILSKIEKVAETCEFVGKEPLFVETKIKQQCFWDEGVGWKLWKIMYRSWKGTRKIIWLTTNWGAFTEIKK